MTDSCPVDDVGGRPGGAGEAAGGWWTRSARTVGGIVVPIFRAYGDDRVVRLGAGLAYYALFAFLPILTLAVWVASMVVSRGDVEDALQQGLEGLLGDASGTAAAELSGALDRTATSAGLGVIGAVTLLVAGSLLILAAQDAFNVIWGVPYQRGVRRTIWRRAVAFGVVLMVGAYLLAVVVAATVGEVLQGLVPGQNAAVDRALGFADSAASWALGVLALAVLYRVLAPVRLAWRHLLVGSALTAVLVVAGSWVLGFYLSRIATTSVTAVAGSALLVLVWFYYEAQILLAGAELIKVLDRRAAASATGDTGSTVESDGRHDDQPR